MVLCLSVCVRERGTSILGSWWLQWSGACDSLSEDVRWVGQHGSVGVGERHSVKGARFSVRVRMRFVGGLGGLYIKWMKSPTIFLGATKNINGKLCTNRKIYLNFVSKCDLKISVKRNFFFKNNFKPVFKFHLEILKVIF